MSVSIAELKAERDVKAMSKARLQMLVAWLFGYTALDGPKQLEALAEFNQAMEEELAEFDEIIADAS